jgi:excisionase family DNA binding protein
METEYYTVEQVAKLLQVSERSIYNWILSGKLAAFKFGDNWRITPANLEAFRTTNQAG